MANGALLLNLIARANLNYKVALQIRSFHNKTTKNGLKKSTSYLKYVYGGGALVIAGGGGGLAFAKLVAVDGQPYNLKARFNELFETVFSRFFAECKQQEVVPKKNRTAHYEETLGGSEILVQKSNANNETFDWAEFFRLVYKEKWYFLAAAISAFAVAILNIQIPQEIGNLINGVYAMLKESKTNITENMMEPSMRLLKLYLTQSLFTFSYIYLLGIMGENMASGLKNRLFERIIKQDISFYDRTRSGELIDRLTTDIQDFKSSFKMCISQGLKSFTQICGCCVSLYLISPKLTLITGLVVPTAILIGSIFGALLRRLSKEAQAQISKSTAVADEAINNVRTVRAFAMEDAESEMFECEVEKARLLNVKLSLGIGIFQGASNLFINGIVLGVLYAGGTMLVNNEINAGQMMAYLAATQMIQRSFTQISILFGQFLKGLSSGGRVFEKVLESFDLDVKPGEIVAIVGHSGSGKSTVCSLLERFYDTDSGQITIDGVDIKDLSPKWLRSKAIGYISQEPILFATSISENIRYGKPDASDEEVIEAAKLANAHDFIEAFPKKYQTVIGERGTTLSGGQKQRVAITRALLKKPKILILDEATSALDSKSERLVQETINNVIKGHTVIIVAHRLSTIKNADKIVVLQNGRIIEVGRHDELMKLRGHYFSLFNLQVNNSEKS